MSRPRYRIEQAEGDLYQVVRINNPRDRSEPMTRAEAERQAAKRNEFFDRLDEEDGPWGGEFSEVAD